MSCRIQLWTRISGENNVHHCIGEFFRGTRIFDSIFRINGTVYSTLARRANGHLLDTRSHAFTRTSLTSRVWPRHWCASAFAVESPCTTTCDERCTVHRFARRHRALWHPDGASHLRARDFPIRSAYLAGASTNASRRYSDSIGRRISVAAGEYLKRTNEGINNPA